jgi:hypothetical protein
VIPQSAHQDAVMPDGSDPRRTRAENPMLQGTRARVIDRKIDIDVLKLDAHLQPIGDTAPEAGKHEEGDDPA